MRADWPNAADSRFISAAGMRWHVQVLGSGPPILLLHGSGAASHSWRDVAPLLAATHTVIVPDLPGHGFTDRPPDEQLSFERIVEDIEALLLALDAEPIAIAGHSAGGALALRLATKRTASSALRGVVGVNAALSRPGALASLIAPGMQLLARTGIIGSLTAMLAESESAFRSLMRSTGSVVTPAQYALYQTFARSPRHASALMTMFSMWDLAALSRSLPTLDVPVTLIVGTNDGWVPPEDSRRAARVLPRARVIEIAGTGHLTHEEAPARVASIIAEAAAASATRPSGEGTARAE